MYYLHWLEKTCLRQTYLGFGLGVVGFQLAWLLISIDVFGDYDMNKVILTLNNNDTVQQNKKVEKQVLEALALSELKNIFFLAQHR